MLPAVTSWLTHFTHPVTVNSLKRHVALKVLTTDCYGQQQDTFELDILQQLKEKTKIWHSGLNHILPLLGQFQHHGPHGKHLCFVFPAMGPDLKTYRRLFPKLRIPVPLVKQIARKLLLALAYLRDVCLVIHTGQHRHARLGVVPMCEE